MIRSESEMRQLTKKILANAETEIVEYKEAKRKFGLDDLGKYFSALSNEANLRSAECGWLFSASRTTGRSAERLTDRNKVRTAQDCRS